MYIHWNKIVICIIFNVATVRKWKDRQSGSSLITEQKSGCRLDSLLYSRWPYIQSSADDLWVVSIWRFRLTSTRIPITKTRRALSFYPYIIEIIVTKKKKCLSLYWKRVLSFFIHSRSLMRNGLVYLNREFRSYYIADETCEPNRLRCSPNIWLTRHVGGMLLPGPLLLTWINFNLSMDEQ